MNDYTSGGVGGVGGALAVTGGAFESEISIIAGVALAVGAGGFWLASKVRRTADSRSSAE